MTTITPAYGRDYTTAKAARADWDAGKDFRIADFFDVDDGRYVNKDTAPGRTFLIRFGGLRKTVVVKG